MSFVKWLEMFLEILRSYDSFVSGDVKLAQAWKENEIGKRKVINKLRCFYGCGKTSIT